MVLAVELKMVVSPRRVAVLMKEEVLMLSQKIIDGMFDVLDEHKSDPGKRERSFSICNGRSGVSTTRTITGTPSSVPAKKCMTGTKRVGLYHTHSRVAAPSTQDRLLAQRFNLEFQCVGAHNIPIVSRKSSEESKDVVYCEFYDGESTNSKIFIGE